MQDIQPIYRNQIAITKTFYDKIKKEVAKYNMDTVLLISTLAVGIIIGIISANFLNFFTFLSLPYIFHMNRNLHSDSISLNKKNFEDSKLCTLKLKRLKAWTRNNLPELTTNIEIINNGFLKTFRGEFRLVNP